MNDPQDFRSPYTPPVLTKAVLDSAEDGGYLAAPRRQPAGRAVQWLGDAWRLFKQQPGLLVAVYLVMTVLSAILGIIPFLGALLQVFFTVLMQAGFAYCFDNIRSRGRFEFGQVFAGFQNNFGNLLLLGLMYMGLFMVIGVMVVLTIGASVFSAEAMGGAAAAGALGAAGVLMILMAGVVALLVVAAFYLAPILVILHNEPVMQAVRLSWQAFVRNIGGAVVCVLLMMVVGVVLALPVMLAAMAESTVLMVVLIFLMMLAVGPIASAIPYAVYRDLFFNED